MIYLKTMLYKIDDVSL